MNSEELEIKFRRYRSNIERAFANLRILNIEKNTMVMETMNKIIELAKMYFKDADFFRLKGDMLSALISLSYCEGLLDALRLMKYIQFEWEN